MNVGDIRVQTTEGVFIPASVRADGSTRKAIRVKEGYIPQEEIGKYVIPAKRGVTGLNAIGIRPRQMANKESHQMTPKKNEKEKESGRIQEPEEIKLKKKEPRPSQQLRGRKRTEPIVNKFDDVSTRRNSQSPQKVPSFPPVSPPAQVVPRAYRPSDSWRNQKSSSSSTSPSSPPESPSVPPAPSFYKPSNSWRYRKSSSSSSPSQSPPRQSRFSDLPSPQSFDPNIDEISNNFSKKCHLNPRK